MLLPKIIDTIHEIHPKELSQERRTILDPLKNYVRKQYRSNAPILLNFICTHNSRRSHLAQIWAHTLGVYFGVKGLVCYSGGTESTAMNAQIVETIEEQGFLVSKLSDGNNPIYSIKFGENVLPIIGFSKKYDDSFNPQSGFAAVLTCDQADEECPLILGADTRIPLSYIDPKSSDGTPQQSEVYFNKSMEIASEMYYVLSKFL